MTRTLTLFGSIALAAATAGHAQLLGGGGIGGGLGGSIGGLGGTMGQFGGGVGGSLRTSRLDDIARADRLHARELRAERRAARHGGSVPAIAASGAATAGGGVATPVDIAGSGTVAGSGALPPRLPGRAVDSVGSRSYAVRAEATAAARGLRRVGRSATGVAVYLPTVAVGVPALAVAYPAYGGDYADPGFVDGGYVAAPPVSMDRQYEALQRATAGTGVTVERRGADLVMQLPADVTFAFDRADIRPRFLPALDAVARTIAEYRDTDVEILGHTDAVGSDAYNFALSQRRGASVADFLVSRRTDPQRLIVEAMGKTEPVASNATIEGRAANRRVEIVLHGRTA